MTREQQLSAVFVEVADSLIDDFDLVEFLQQVCAHCVDLLDVSAAGILLVGHDQALKTVAASDENTHLLELFVLEVNEGPCLECFRTSEPRINIDLCDPRATTAWPAFAANARKSGFRTSHVVPLRRRERAIGALSFFHTGTQPLTPADASLAQALADIATIALLQQRDLDDEQTEKAQLQRALISRIVIEQAKGILAERWQTTPEAAFQALRAHARNRQLRLTECSRQIIDQTFDTNLIPPPST
ncbi:transcriptional regulator [Streptomyces spiroverticillatus]|uniref:Transcriptional regulator n=1 Tax=Streptomyces finlayi TaxID=67296 RepID=A0A918X1Y6_9ACTN|nr:GAF and ANTAR domain-containing protein [Streptomyces finlayi]GHA22112.1 transcriptional regulator [Streptomyces spiroverticillatus]GHD04208.1 transcriptional regulator [Streptomyces finlayi]